MAKKHQVYHLLSEKWLHVEIQVLSASVFCVYSQYLVWVLINNKRNICWNQAHSCCHVFLGSVIMYNIQLTRSYMREGVGPDPLERTLSFIPVPLSLSPTPLYIPSASPHLLLLDQVHPWNSLTSGMVLPLLQVHMSVMCMALTLYYTFSFQQGPMPTAHHPPDLLFPTASYLLPLHPDSGSQPITTIAD